MNPIILFRKNYETEDEFNIAKKYFDVFEQRNAVPSNSLVIGRYSVLPYFRELEADIKIKDSKLIDDYRSFQYIADFDYYFDIEPYTFYTWFDGSKLPDGDTQYILKGKTNSRKAYFSEKMFAKNKKDAIFLSTILRKIHS